MTKRLWVLLLGAVIFSSCTGETDTSASSSSVLVFAAASLADAFTEMESAFEANNPTVDVELNFAGSSALREQILDGAPADVFATANGSTMQAVIDAELASTATVFARNWLAIAVETGNPTGVSGLESFEDAERFLGVCAAGVPCGDLATQVFENAVVDPAVDTEEPDVRALLNKVAIGELDAGIVYATDIAANDEVDGVGIPDLVNVSNDYPIALLNAAESSGAQLFVDFVLGSSGRDILLSHGFVTP